MKPKIFTNKLTNENLFSTDFSIQSWMDYFLNSPPIYGGIDFFCSDLHLDMNFLSGLIATIQGLRNSDAPLYKKIKIIFPFGNNNTLINLDILINNIIEKLIKYDYSLQSLDDLMIVTFKENFKNYLSEIIEVQTSPSNELIDLCKIIDNTEESTAIILIDGDLFSSNKESISPILTTQNTPVNESLKLWSSEDIWVNSIISVINSVSELLQKNQLFLIITVQQSNPVKDANIKKFEVLDNVNSLFTCTSNENAIAEANISRWLELSINQEIDLVLEEIDREIKNDFNGAIIKAQCLAAADHPHQGFKLIQPLIEDILLNSHPSLLVTLARISSAAGQREVTIKLLKQSLDKNLAEQTSLENAFRIAKLIDAVEEKTEIQIRLAELYPLSMEVINRQFNSALNKNDFNELYGKLNAYVTSHSDNETAGFFCLLTELLITKPLESLDEIIDIVAAKFPDYKSATAYYCGLYASKRGRYSKALALLVSEKIGPKLEEFALLELISVIEQLFIAKPFYEPVDSADEITSAQVNRDSVDRLNIEKGFNRILKYLSQNPVNGGMRNSFLQMISPSTSGLNGILWLIQTILNHDFTSQKLIERETKEAKLVKPEDIREILEVYLLKMQKPVVLGMSDLPNIKSKYSLDQILETFREMLNDNAYKGISDIRDLNFYHILLHIVIKLNQKLKTGKEFEALSTAGASLTGIGYNQAARNLAEEALALSLLSKTDDSLRAAWMAYADIYQRCHNKIEALIGLACVLQISDAEVSIDELFIQRVLFIRILRDFDYFADALREIDEIKILADQTASSKRSQMMLGVMESQIELILIGYTRGEISRNERIILLKELGEKTFRLHLNSQESSKEIFPTALLLAQINRSLIEENDHLSNEITIGLLDSLDGTNSYFTDLALALASNNPSVEDIQKLLINFNQNSFLSDFATDIYPIAQLARIALSNININESYESVIYLLEVLSLLSINTPLTNNFTEDKNLDAFSEASRKFMGSVLHRENYHLDTDEANLVFDLVKETNLSIKHPEKVEILSIKLILEFVNQLNENGISVISLGLDSKETLVVFSSENQQIVVRRESETIFNSVKYYSWKELYPFDYVNIASDEGFAFNILVQTLEGIGVSLSKSANPILFITSSALQSIPPNLYLADDEPVGLSRPTAVAPSINWLQKLNSETDEWRNNYKAWIPKIDKNEDALTMLFEQTESMLLANHFSIFTEESDLRQMKQSDIAVIGAHGSVYTSDQLFKAISNEGEIRLTGLQMSKYLSNCKLVILFICSGGRLDSAPYSSASVGLPYEILNQGARSVIASPYPLDVRVPRIWLEAFINELFKGNSVINSNFQANSTVAKAFNYNPVYSLAMNVFGDPLLKIPEQKEHIY